jgi:hypothetical protein
MTAKLKTSDYEMPIEFSVEEIEKLTKIANGNSSKKNYSDVDNFIDRAYRFFKERDNKSIINSTPNEEENI